MFYILSYLGQIAGYILGWNSPEEMKQGEKYFTALKRTFFIFIMIYLIFLTFRRNNLKLNIILFVIGLALSFIIKYEYLGFGFIPIDWISSSLIFLYGIPYGTLLYIKKNKKQLLINLLFFIPLIVCWYFKLDLSALALGLILTRFK